MAQDYAGWGHSCRHLLVKLIALLFYLIVNVLNSDSLNTKDDHVRLLLFSFLS